MQKWEYCMISGIRVDSIGTFQGHYPKLYYFGVDGISREVDLGKGAASRRPERFTKVSEGEYIAHAIATLGSQGWEMIGTNKSNDQNGEGSHSIYFKRPLE